MLEVHFQSHLKVVISHILGTIINIGI